MNHKSENSTNKFIWKTKFKAATAMRQLQMNQISVIWKTLKNRKPKANECQANMYMFGMVQSHISFAGLCVLEPKTCNYNLNDSSLLDSSFWSRLAIFQNLVLPRLFEATKFKMFMILASTPNMNEWFLSCGHLPWHGSAVLGHLSLGYLSTRQP